MDEIQTSRSIKWLVQSGRDVCLYKNCIRKKHTAPVNSKTRNTEQRNKQQQKKLGSTLHRQCYECANWCCLRYLCKPSTFLWITHFLWCSANEFNFIYFRSLNQLATLKFNLLAMLSIQSNPRIPVIQWIYNPNNATAQLYSETEILSLLFSQSTSVCSKLKKAKPMYLLEELTVVRGKVMFYVCARITVLNQFL